MSETQTQPQHESMSPSRPGLVGDFVSAMEALERSGSTDELVALYDPSCRLGNVVHPSAYDGHEGVITFWTRYRDQFDEVRSEYGVVAGDDSGAVLEWTTTGTAAGAEVRYRGATVLEVVDGRIVRSMAYFDPAGLGRQVLDDASPGGRSRGDESSEPGRDDAPPGWSGPAEPGAPAPETTEPPAAESPDR